MKRPSRDTWVTIGIIVGVFILVAVVAVLTRPPDSKIPLDVTSVQPNGAKALWEWLDRLGYDLSEKVGAEYAIPYGTDAVFILEASPFYPFNEDELDTLSQWVRQGGTLLVAGQSMGTVPVFDRLEFGLDYSSTSDYPLHAASPLIANPPLPAGLSWEWDSFLRPDTGAYVPLITSDEKLYAVLVPHGRGQVILVASADPFTNAGLQEPGAPELVLNLIAPVPAGSRIWFDEWHHGKRGAGSVAVERYGPENWLLHTAPGRSVLLGAALFFVSLLLAGRRFGRAVPLPAELQRRSALEHVAAVANLNRRAGQRAALLQHYHHQLKRRLGQRYRLDTNLADDEYVNQLAAVRPEIDAEALRRLLRDLGQANVSEQRLVELANEAARWIQSSQI